MNSVPGWPSKWPLPAAWPRPFDPPDFIIGYDVLCQAAAKVQDAEACRLGNPDAIAKLLVEIMKMVHESPGERNIYLNPNRADQVLVYVPSQWNVMPLPVALRLVFGHVADGLADVSAIVPTQTRVMARAATDALRDDGKARRVVSKSMDAMAAHLGNLALQLLDNSCALQTVTAPPELKLPDRGVKPRQFGQERYGHMEAVATVCAFENVLGVYHATDLREDRLLEMARRLLIVYAQMLTSRRPENLTALFVGGDTLYVYSASGWTVAAADESAKAQARTFGENIARYIRVQDSTILVPLAAYLETHLDEVAAKEATEQVLLRQFAAETSRYYGLPVAALLPPVEPAAELQPDG